MGLVMGKTASRAVEVLKAVENLAPLKLGILCGTGVLIYLIYTLGSGVIEIQKSHEERLVSVEKAIAQLVDQFEQHASKGD